MLGSGNVTPWDSSAEIYAAVAPRIGFYRDTAYRCVAAASLGSGMSALDIACGSSTLVVREIFRAVPTIGTVVAIDSSANMIEEARRRCANKNTMFIHCSAEEIDSCVGTKFDAAICNSAFWQFDIRAATKAISKALNPGGVLTFTLPQWDLELENTEDDPKYDVIDSVLLEKGISPKPHRGSETKFKTDQLIEILNVANFYSVNIEYFTTEVSAEDYKLFYRIPAIASKSLPHVPITVSMAVLAEATERLENVKLPALKWAVFRAERSLT